jgi:flagellar FliL protein
MSTAAATAPVETARGGKKKLIVIAAAAALALAVLGGGALVWMKRQAAAALESAEADEAEDGAHAAAAPKRDPKATPVYVSLDNFTVNLADREVDRYAQIGISLELNDTKYAEPIKVFMPAIRNNILMVLSHKRAAELLERAGKEKLAAEVQHETERAIGFESSAKKPPAPSQRPVRAVHFSNFIIQ